jgi:hypothetical protein
MKKITLVLVSILFTSFVWAQDVIVTKDGKKINSKVTEINENDIKYKNFENLDGPTYSMKKLEIASILYANGQVEVFNLSMNTTPPTQQAIPISNVQYVQQDLINAKNLRNAGIICFAGGMGLFVTGLIVAGTSVNYWYIDYEQALAGTILTYVGASSALAGAIMWPIGQIRLNKIRRANPNGFSLFENEKIQLNLALGGNIAGLKLNF